MTWDLKSLEKWPVVKWLVTLYPRVSLRHKVTVGTLISAILAVGLYAGLRQTWPMVQPDNPWMLLLLFVTGEFLLFLSLFLSTHKRGLPNPIQQWLRIRVSNPDGTAAEYDAGYIRANVDGRPSGERIDLSPASVYEGLDHLHRSMPPSEGFGLCVGINTAGIVFASFLAKRYDIDQERIGAVLTSKKLKGDSRFRRHIFPARELIRDCYGPDDTFQKKILLVDSEFKTGGNAEYAVSRLIDVFSCQRSDIWYVALVVTHMPLEVLSSSSVTLADIIDRRSVKKVPTAPIPHRFAYFVPGYVEMPHGIP